MVAPTEVVVPSSPLVRLYLRDLSPGGSDYGTRSDPNRVLEWAGGPASDGLAPPAGGLVD
jgi:hypothetical protein